MRCVNVERNVRAKKHGRHVCMYCGRSISINDYMVRLNLDTADELDLGILPRYVHRVCQRKKNLRIGWLA